MLWTLAGLLHALADLGLWHLTACACCFNSCLARMGPYIAVCIAAVLCAGSTLAILMRATYEIQVNNADDQADDDQIEWLDVKNVEAFQFLGSYFIELIFV